MFLDLKTDTKELSGTALESGFNRLWVVLLREQCTLYSDVQCILLYTVHYSVTVHCIVTQCNVQ